MQTLLKSLYLQFQIPGKKNQNEAGMSDERNQGGKFYPGVHPQRKPGRHHFGETGYLTFDF